MTIRENIALSDNGFVFNPSTGDSFTMNPTGTEVVTQIRQGRTIDEIKESILASYDVDRNVLDKFLNDFIEDLLGYNLLEDKQ